MTKFPPKDLLLVVAAALVVAGVAQIYPPAAWITAGVLLGLDALEIKPRRPS